MGYGMTATVSKKSLGHHWGALWQKVALPQCPSGGVDILSNPPPLGLTGAGQATVARLGWGGFVMAAIKSIQQLERDGYRMVADCESGWAIFVAEPNEAGWVKVRLRRVNSVKKGRQGRRSFNLSWNGQRFANGGDFVTAPRNLVVWAENVLQERAA